MNIHIKQVNGSFWANWPAHGIMTAGVPSFASRQFNWLYGFYFMHPFLNHLSSFKWNQRHFKRKCLFPIALVKHFPASCSSGNTVFGRPLGGSCLLDASLNFLKSRYRFRCKPSETVLVFVVNVKILNYTQKKQNGKRQTREIVVTWLFFHFS